LSSQTQVESVPTISAREQLLESLKDPEYRAEFVRERVRSSIALQIRALREQREQMTQKELGEAIGMAQTWVSKLENPEYGKMTVATLLRLATEAFDTDLEIKFRPFSEALDVLPHQGPAYFRVPSFEEELTDLERPDVFTVPDALAHMACSSYGQQSTNGLQEVPPASSAISQASLTLGVKQPSDEELAIPRKPSRKAA
jgi:transcriptional regulator with XRE-family HTH domain